MMDNEVRYDIAADFLILDKDEPLPAGFEILITARDTAYAEHRNAAEARRGLRSHARQCGANALLEVHTEHVNDFYAFNRYYECRGLPAIVARRNPRGRFTRNQLLRSFYAPRQTPSRRERSAAFWANERQAGQARHRRTEQIYNFLILLWPILLIWFAYDGFCGNLGKNYLYGLRWLF